MNPPSLLTERVMPAHHAQEDAVAHLSEPISRALDRLEEPLRQAQWFRTGATEQLLDMAKPRYGDDCVRLSHQFSRSYRQEGAAAELQLDVSLDCEVGLDTGKGTFCLHYGLRDRDGTSRAHHLALNLSCALAQEQLEEELRRVLERWDGSVVQHALKTTRPDLS